MMEIAVMKTGKIKKAKQIILGTELGVSLEDFQKTWIQPLKLSQSLAPTSSSYL